MDKLQILENKSIFLLREAYFHFPRLGMLWSMGKDSTVLLWLARKAFLRQIPFPLIHIDTRYKIPEMIEYRDRLVRELGLTLIVASNEADIKNKKTYPDQECDRTTCCHRLKTTPLTDLLSGKGTRYIYEPETKKTRAYEDTRPFQGLILGIRSDEEGSRSKERYFSYRGADHSWDIENQYPELWNQLNTEIPPDQHVRVHPLLDWTELDIWKYIEKEQIPTVSLYYDQGTGSRYRSLGCAPCTFPVQSPAKNPSDIIQELETGKFSREAERSGRAQDKVGSGLESLRRKGYM